MHRNTAGQQQDGELVEQLAQRAWQKAATTARQLGCADCKLQPSMHKKKKYECKKNCNSSKVRVANHESTRNVEAMLGPAVRRRRRRRRRCEHSPHSDAFAQAAHTAKSRLHSLQLLQRVVDVQRLCNRCCFFCANVVLAEAAHTTTKK